MTAPRRVSVAILSWNGRHHLETCLEALAGQDPPGVDWEILVLDNGSTDGTAAWLRQCGGRWPRVSCIESTVNLGFCAGNNRLVAAASGDAVAFLNNDTRPCRGWLAALVAALAAAPPDVAAVSGRIVDWAGERLDFGRGVMTFDGHAFQLDFRRPLAAARIPAAGDELLFACGGNMLIRRASFLAAGGFDESYFAYLEDVDLGWRLWSGGERVTFVPDAVVHHRSSATSDLLGLFNRGFLFERNAFLTAYKNYEPGLWERIMPALLLTFLSRTQTMLADNNPGGGSLRIDPYAGWIANTGTPARGGTPAAFSTPGAAAAAAASPAPAVARAAPAAAGAAPAKAGTAPATAAEAVPASAGAQSAAAGARPATPGALPAAAPRAPNAPGAPSAPAAAAGAPASGAGSDWSPASIGRKWRQHGTLGLARRGAARLRRELGQAAREAVQGMPWRRAGGQAGAAVPAPLLTDERSVAQLRALSYLLAHLDDAAGARQAVQARRRRSDREIFARFPLYLVPTYPGDETLFASAGFASWLPADLPLRRQTLAEVMELEE